MKYVIIKVKQMSQEKFQESGVQCGHVTCYSFRTSTRSNLFYEHWTHIFSCSNSPYVINLFCRQTLKIIH